MCKSRGSDEQIEPPVGHECRPFPFMRSSISSSSPTHPLSLDSPQSSPHGVVGLIYLVNLETSAGDIMPPPDQTSSMRRGDMSHPLEGPLL